MDEGYEVLIHADDSHGLQLYLERLSAGVDSKLNFAEYEAIDAAVERLNEGESDLILLDGLNWHQTKTSGLIIAAVLPRKEPTLVMVSDDKPEYLPSKAIISVEQELVKRQIRRLRNDLVIIDSDSLGIDSTDSLKRLEELESLRASGEIDAHICSRENHARLSARSRRHTLGLHRESDDRQSFIPPVLAGFAVLIARRGFPVANIAQLNDQAAQIELITESTILDQVDNEIREFTAINVQLRRVGAILREADKRGDDSIKEGLLGFEGVLQRKGNRLHMCIETLSENGKVTARAERMIPVDDSNSGIIRLLEEHTALIELLTSDIESHPKHGDAASGMMILGDHSSS